MGALPVRPYTMPCAEFDRDADRISSTIVDALATAADTDPLSLEPPLYDAVDGEALDALVCEATNVRVEFEYAGRTVVVRDGGTVEIDGTVYERDGRS